MKPKEKFQLRIGLAKETKERISKGLPVMDSAVKNMEHIEWIANQFIQHEGRLPRWWNE